MTITAGMLAAGEEAFYEEMLTREYLARAPSHEGLMAVLSSVFIAMSDARSGFLNLGSDPELMEAFNGITAERPSDIEALKVRSGYLSVLRDRMDRAQKKASQPKPVR